MEAKLAVKYSRFKLKIDLRKLKTFQAKESLFFKKSQTFMLKLEKPKSNLKTEIGKEDFFLSKTNP